MTEGKWHAWVHIVRDENNNEVAQAAGRAEAQQIADEHNELLVMRAALERLLVSAYTGDDVEASQLAAQKVLDTMTPEWADKYA